MKVSVVTQPLPALAVDALVLGLPAGERRFPPPLAELDRRLEGQLRAVVDAEKFAAKPGTATHLHVPARLREAAGVLAPRVIVVGLGPRRDLTLDVVRRAAAAGTRRARDLGARVVAVEILGERPPVRQRAQAVAEAAVLATYAFDRYKREKADRQVEDLRLVAPDARSARDAADGARAGETFAAAACFARDLVNSPANDIHPTHLARVAQQVAKAGRLGLHVYDRAECEKMGMGAFLGVAAGSEQPPRFLHLTYTPGAARPRKRVAIVGKGITFDSGGLDLKPPDGMLRMKYDMAGAAVVLGVMRALPALRPPVEVHGLIAATENMPSGSAFRPGDVLRAMNGTTIEIGNTDAEGRLTLADALSYAVARVKPDEILDFATLTGACMIALGPLCAGMMTNDQPLGDRLLAAARQSGELVWQLPLIDEYREGLKSEVADLNNVGPRGGGAITAGIFLKEFVGATPWAHFDIAGVAYTEKDLPLVPKGATGAAVRTVLTYLTQGAGATPARRR
jgi:leucyl aminopeptidase